MLQRWHNAFIAWRERKRGRLRGLLYRAMPYYDSDYDGGWNMEKLIDKILEICDGKEVETINKDGKMET